MNYIRTIREYNSKKPAVVTLGKFDGVHQGHRLLMDEVLRSSREEDLTAIVFTFDISPQTKISHTDAASLMTNRERFLCLEKMGIETLFECPFTEEIRSMEAEAFVSQILLDGLHVSKIVVGDDFRFGRGRSGDAQMLKKMAGSGQFQVEVIGKKRDEVTGREISSTWIREELQKGDIETVNRLMAEPYFLLGEVVHGRRLGRILNIPTINQIPASDKLLPPNGVYFSRTQIREQSWYGITNIGTKPTVEGEWITAETHLFDCDEDLYGCEARVELLKYHRPERRFPSIEALKAQMEADIREARDFLTVKL